MLDLGRESFGLQITDLRTKQKGYVTTFVMQIFSNNYLERLLI